MRAFYLRDERNRPVTLVLVEAIDDNTVDGDAVHFAVATCHEDDIYDKTMAYHIASCRLEMGKSVTLAMTPHIKRSIIEYIAFKDDPAKFGRYTVVEREYLHPDQVLYPRRARAAAKYWLSQID